jgi:hemoglobin
MFSKFNTESAVIIGFFLLATTFHASAMDDMSTTNPSPSVNLGTTVLSETDTFKDFGGKEGLVKIMDDFMINLVNDPVTKPFFDNDKQAFIKAMLVEQICEILNGGCKYSGRDMTSAHANMRVNRAAFNALVEDFQLAMDKHNVPFSSQNKLLAKLAPMYRVIETTTGDASAVAK